MAQDKSGKFKLGVVNGTEVNTEHDFSYREFATVEDVKSSADWNDKALLELVNSHEKASAKALAYQAAAKATGLMPDPEDPAVRRVKAIKALILAGVPKDIAEQTIDAALASQA